nr:PREDICTED: 39S ribosomal protein L46, mitochondrial [Bemisia tabaci]
MFKVSCVQRGIPLKFVNLVACSISKSYSSLAQHSSKDPENRISEKWDVMSAVCIERNPIVSRELNELETKVASLLERLELENSKKCNFELKYQKEKAEFDKLKKTSTQVEDEEATIPSQDFIDKNTAELNNLQAAPRTTEADKNKDVKSLDRCLDSRLLLVIKKKLGNKSLWHLPQDVNREDETLRQTAERIVKETFGDGLNVKLRGNAPAGYYKYKYKQAPEETDQPVGAKVFFYKAKYLNGGFEPKNFEDFQWATMEELKTLLIPPYYKDVSMFLIDEESRNIDS